MLPSQIDNRYNYAQQTPATTSSSQALACRIASMRSYRAWRAFHARLHLFLLRVRCEYRRFLPTPTGLAGAHRWCNVRLLHVFRGDIPLRTER